MMIKKMIVDYEEKMMMMMMMMRGWGGQFWYEWKILMWVELLNVVKFMLKIKKWVMEI